MKPEFKKKLEALEAAEKDRRAQLSPQTPYNPRKMNLNRMPLGCWMWVIAMVVVAVYFARKCGVL